MIYSLPYVGFISVLLLLSYIQLGLKLSDRLQNVMIFATMLVVTLFLGFRGFIGTDWVIYASFYSILPDNFFDIISKVGTYHFEKGFVVYVAFIKTILSCNFHGFVFVSFITDITLLSVFVLRYLPKKYFAFFVAMFMVFYGLTFEVDLMRNVKSLLLFLLSLQYIENRKWAKYFLLNLIGLSFHWSSLIFLPLYFFLHKPMSLRTFVVLFIIGNVVFLSQLSFIKPIIMFIGNTLGGTYQERVIAYLNSDIYGRNAVLSFGYLERLFVSFAVIFYYGKLKLQSKSNILFLNAFIIYILLYLFGRELEILSIRFCALFAFSYWILVPQIMRVSDNIMKYILLLVFTLLSVAKIYKQTNNVLYQYDTLLTDKIKTYEERYKIFDKNIDDELDRK